MILPTTFFTSLLLLAVVKNVERRPMVVHEYREGPPSGFVNSGAPLSTKGLTLRIGLKPNNMGGLEDALYKVSDPASAMYGQYLTQEEVAEFVKPTDETQVAVSEWLSENGIPSKPVTSAGDILEITLSVARANKLLDTVFSVFTHTATGTNSIRTLEYSIPASLQGHVEFFHPTISFTPPLTAGPKVVGARPKPASTPTVAPDNTPINNVPASCATAVTPECLQALYSIPSSPAQQTSNILGVPGFMNMWANSLDLQQFLGMFRPDISNQTTFKLQTMNDGINDQTRSAAGIEAYTVGVATGVPVTFISVGSNNTDDELGGFMDIITTILAEDPATRPHVLSTSYAFNEEYLPRPLATRLCNMYAGLGAMGAANILLAMFQPTFPSSCPFVTSVGATRGINEVGASLSAGGFSNYFSVPLYQIKDVPLYLVKNGLHNIGKFNATGRGFPDVAAQGENYVISGTSASTPAFASLIALLNDQLITAGKPTLGFLNPLLYSSSGRAALKDITYGNGFYATKGWDPITGLGTPNFKLLKTAVGL
ncbi:family S53 protease [Mycena pura]|uniref:Family S53 protease n=1 Tax=Mycena pura TaxID=153505 RepID=A0AAD6V0F5_9AGAR|nr:family S53 protease [Mycena pura]